MTVALVTGPCEPGIKRQLLRLYSHMFKTEAAPFHCDLLTLEFCSLPAQPKDILIRPVGSQQPTSAVHIGSGKLRGASQWRYDGTRLMLAVNFREDMEVTVIR
ncbi:MAG: hypothetical protein FJ279_37495 [Planctomycetes bacterium]|nr:hypothetical protein [Planctomycetota bacterium]